MSNITDMEEFKKRKGIDDKVRDVEPVCIINDMLAYRLADGDIIETIQNDEVTARRVATPEEVNMLRTSQFHEAMLAHLAQNYAPHLRYDDYLYYPYIDWELMSQNPEFGEGAKLLGERAAPYVKFQRSIHRLITDVREVGPENELPLDIGLTAPTSLEEGAYFSSNRSPLIFHVATTEDIEGDKLIVTFQPKEGDDPASHGYFSSNRIKDGRNRSKILFGMLAIDNLEKLSEFLQTLTKRHGDKCFGFGLKDKED